MFHIGRREIADIVNRLHMKLEIVYETLVMFRSFISWELSRRGQGSYCRSTTRYLIIMSAPTVNSSKVDR